MLCQRSSCNEVKTQKHVAHHGVVGACGWDIQQTKVWFRGENTMAVESDHALIGAESELS